MTNRYMTEEFVGLWSDQNKFETMLRVELEALFSMEYYNTIPSGTYSSLQSLKVSLPEILKLEETCKHETIAFISSLEQQSPNAKWLHFGLTSSDILDTTNAILLTSAVDIISFKLDQVLSSLKDLALNHASTLMIGRSHGIHAEPTTFGYVVGSHYQEFLRAKVRLHEARKTIAVGKLSGAVGTFAYVTPDVESMTMKSLGLSSEPIATQVISRDRYADLFATLGLIASAVERFATTIRHLQRTEVGEVAEGFSSGQKGSSAMPHKKNPILSENLCGLARVVRSAITPAFENIALWHERDMSHSSVERFICPEATSTTGFMLDRLKSVIDNLFVNSDRMKENFESSYGVYASQGILLELVKAGMERQAAYALVQKNSFLALKNKIPFKQQLFSDMELCLMINFFQIENCCDVNVIVNRCKERLELLLT
jgi:adenylosuccinate lyase